MLVTEDRDLRREHPVTRTADLARCQAKPLAEERLVEQALPPSFGSHGEPAGSASGLTNARPKVIPRASSIGTSTSSVSP